MEAGAGRTSVRDLLVEFVVFGLKQARACVFPGLFILVLLISGPVAEFLGVARYDFIFVGAILVQVVLVALRVETRDEALTLCAFHLLGLALEIFKTNPAIGSWSYPEEGFFEVFGVPLYSGFMYAALVVFLRTKVFFTVVDGGPRRKMPLMVSFLLIGFFVWVAENVSTFLGAWSYPDQLRTWNLVSLGKISSWCLLVIISFVIVADLKHARAERRKRTAES